MVNLQVKNIPESLHQQLRRCAKQRKSTLSEVVLEAVKRELARSAFHERMANCSPVDLGVSAASLLEEERHQSHQEREC
jgi:plasmid stability protein